MKCNILETNQIAIFSSNMLLCLFNFNLFTHPGKYQNSYKTIFSMKVYFTQGNTYVIKLLRKSALTKAGPNQFGIL